MTRRLVAAVLASLVSSSLFAAITLGPGFSAVDAKFIRHSSKDYRGKPQFFSDLAYVLMPAYPSFDERRGNQGSGLFRITIDLKTGAASNVAILKSTGHVSLDRRVLLALKVWRWKPGTWQQVDVPITFQAGGTIYLPPGTRLPPKL